MKQYCVMVERADGEINFFLVGPNEKQAYAVKAMVEKANPTAKVDVVLATVHGELDERVRPGSVA